MNPGPNPSADHRDRTPVGQAGGRGAASGREVLAGLVERVTFHNSETGFCVLRIKARGHRDLVTTVGHAATISAGEWITASGEWTNDRTHGLQFRARFLKASALCVSNSQFSRRCTTALLHEDPLRVGRRGPHFSGLSTGAILRG